MKNHSSSRPNALPVEPTEDEIRDYAYHLYQQSDGQSGHDVDNWLEASACLKANIPRHFSHHRLHLHVTGEKSPAVLV